MSVSVAAVDASSNLACAICPTITTIRDVRVPVADVGASNTIARVPHTPQ
jgi:hypothetical protein